MVRVPVNWIDKVPNATQTFLLYTAQVIAQESFGKSKAIPFKGGKKVDVITYSLSGEVISILLELLFLKVNEAYVLSCSETLEMTK